MSLSKLEDMAVAAEKCGACFCRDDAQVAFVPLRQSGGDNASVTRASSTVGLDNVLERLDAGLGMRPHLLTRVLALIPRAV